MLFISPHTITVKNDQLGLQNILLGNVMIPITYKVYKEDTIYGEKKLKIMSLNLDFPKQ
jgi:hypothetical protein